MGGLESALFQTAYELNVEFSYVESGNVLSVQIDLHTIIDHTLLRR